MIFPDGGINDVRGVEMRTAERVRSWTDAQLFGSIIKVTPTSFLIGLSGRESEAQHNLKLLNERPWLEMLVGYGDGRRAIIAVDKGATGVRAFTEAFEAWGQSKKQPAQPAIATIQPEGSAQPAQSVYNVDHPLYPPPLLFTPQQPRELFTPQQPREAVIGGGQANDQFDTSLPSLPPPAHPVVLYEEDPDDPQGKHLFGTAVWRTEMMAAAPGGPAELAVRADIEVPERRMTMTFTLLRNSDASLPASHTIEIKLNLPPDAPSGGVIA